MTSRAMFVKEHRDWPYVFDSTGDLSCLYTIDTKCLKSPQPCNWADPHSLASATAKVSIRAILEPSDKCDSDASGVSSK